jgi:copper oxidase (laccase) domain-containing protein
MQDGKSYYDHTGFVLARLAEVGIEPARVEDLGGDTLAQDDIYHSYRAAKAAEFDKCGHNVAAICLPRS